MKVKNLLFGLLSSGLAMTSCNLDVDDSENYNNNTYGNVANLLIPVAEGNASAMQDTYVITDYFYAGNLAVTSTNFSTGISKGAFTTSPMDYTVETAGQYPYLRSIVRFQGGHAAGSGFTVSNLEGFVTAFPTLLPDSATMIKDYPYQPVPSLVISYNVNDAYNVRTFAWDAVYGGKTSVKAAMSPVPMYEGEETFYRLYFHTDMKQADMIVYGAKFASQMPPLTFVLKNLDVVYNRQGFTVQKPAGEEYMIPYVPEGQNQSQVLVPYPSRRISQLMFTPTSTDLTNAMLDFSVQMVNAETVTATFNCEFTGAYCSSEIEK